METASGKPRKQTVVFGFQSPVGFLSIHSSCYDHTKKGKRNFIAKRRTVGISDAWCLPCLLKSPVQNEVCTFIKPNLLNFACFFSFFFFFFLLFFYPQFQSTTFPIRSKLTGELDSCHVTWQMATLAERETSTARGPRSPSSLSCPLLVKIFT